MKKPQDLTITLTPEAIDALEERGIAAEIAVELGIVSVERGRDDRAWIGFRHFVDGSERDHWHFRTVTGAKRFYQSKGTERRLWRNEVITDERLKSAKLIITEGHLDAAAIYSCGFERVVSVPDGAPDSQIDEPKKKYAYFERAGLEAVDEIVIATDGDTPGLSLAADIAIYLGPQKCKMVRWPDGCKDAGDVLLKHGRDELVRIIDGANWYALDGYFSSIYDRPRFPPTEPIDCGLDGLRDLWRPAIGGLTVLTGIPGHGKSSLMTDLLGRIATNSDRVVCCASLEDDLDEHLRPRLISWRLRKPYEYCKPEEIETADEWLDRQFCWIQPAFYSDEATSVDWFMTRAEAAVTRDRATVIVLDPWNEIDHSTKFSDESVTDYTGEMIKRFRQHARRFRYHLILCAHPTKLKKIDGKYPVPSGYDISDSAHWRNKADHGLTVYRTSDNTTLIESWKCKREPQLGAYGKRMFSFSQPECRYKHRPDLEDD